MSRYLVVLAIAFLPAIGNIVGSLLAESVRTPKWLIGAALHAAAGIAIAVVSVDLMPRILRETPPWLLIVAFFCGAVFSVILSRLVEWLRPRKGKASAGAWMVYMAVAADLFSDGLMTGTGSAIGSNLGLLLGLSQVVANIPGGFASGANFRDDDVPRRRRLMFVISFPAPALLSASLGFGLLQHADSVAQHAALSFMVGVLLLATVEDMLPQADEPHAARWISTTSFAGGFAVFALLSLYIGGGR